MPGSESALADQYCAPPRAEGETFVADVLPGPAISREEQLAALLGLYGAYHTSGPRSAEDRLRILERLDAARLAVSATAAELDCESERLRQAAEYLGRRQSARVQGLTVASIAAAAVAGVASVLLSTRDASSVTQNTVGISGSVATTALGLSTISVHTTLTVHHERNLLADIWTGPLESTRYPVVVWAYLSLPVFSNAEDRPIREKIVGRWRQLLQLDNDRVAQARFFGAGGTYDMDSLRLHVALLDHVKAEVALASQELRSLAQRLAR